MTTTLEQVNNEKMNKEAFDHLSPDMKGVVLHSLAEELRNEEIMVKLSLSEKELKDLCIKYGIAFSHRNTHRRLDGERVISNDALEVLLAEGTLSFQDFIAYDRASQRKILYAFVEKTGKLNPTIRSVFGVKFYNYFTAIYYEEKAARSEKKTGKNEPKKQGVTLINEPVIEQVQTPNLESILEPFFKPMQKEMSTATPAVHPSLPSEEELYHYVTSPREQNPNDLTSLTDIWDSPFGVEKQYTTQYKNQKATKRQVKMHLHYLLQEMDELDDDALLSIDVKITEHTVK